MSDPGTNSLIDMDDEEDFVDPELALQNLLDDPKLIQHFMRTVSDGCDTIVGYFRISFESGQQRQVLHVPFVPPLKIVPQVEADACNLQDVRVRVTDCQKFGIRVEVVLPQPADSEKKLLVEIIATEAL